MSVVEPSEKVPVDVNCWVEPTAKLAGEGGDNVTEDKAGAGVAEAVGVGTITVKMMDGLVMPDKDAEILTVPAVTPIAKPAEDMVAMLVFETAQVA